MFGLSSRLAPKAAAGYPVWEALRAILDRSLESILEKSLDRVPLEEGLALVPTSEHVNLRGAAYYAAEGKRCF